MGLDMNGTMEPVDWAIFGSSIALGIYWMIFL